MREGSQKNAVSNSPRAVSYYPSKKRHLGGSNSKTKGIISANTPGVAQRPGAMAMGACGPTPPRPDREAAEPVPSRPFQAAIRWYTLQ